MRRSYAAQKRRERLQTFIISALAGIGALTVSAALLSAAAVICDMSDSAVKAMSGIALAAGCFSCAFFAANQRRRNGLSSGLICGLCIFGAVFIAGMLTVRVFSAGGIAIKLVIMLSASAIGGIKGVNTRPVFRK